VNEQKSLGGFAKTSQLWNKDNQMQFGIFMCVWTNNFMWKFQVVA